ncbi:hypothetical protein GCM10023146_29340 [Nocardioides caricicola]
MSHNQKRVTMTSPGTPEVSTDVVERFQPTSGRLPGAIGLLTAAIVLGLAVWPRSTGTPLGVAIVACFGALVTWLVLLRPALWVTEHDLVLRNILTTTYVPLAAVDRVLTTQVLTVTAGERRFISPVVGYTLRQNVTGRNRDAKAPSAVDTYQVFVEERILFHADTARERLRITKGSAEQQALASGVRRALAWPEIAGLAGLALVFVAWFFAH